MSKNNNICSNASNKAVVLFCSYDYLAIVNENSEPFGVYCGRRTGKSVVVTGKYAVLTFHSNSVVQKRGFLLLLTAFKPGKFNNEIPIFFLQRRKNRHIATQEHFT